MPAVRLPQEGVRTVSPSGRGAVAGGVREAVPSQLPPGCAAGTGELGRPGRSPGAAALAGRWKETRARGGVRCAGSALLRRKELYEFALGSVLK